MATEEPVAHETETSKSLEMQNTGTVHEIPLLDQQATSSMERHINRESTGGFSGTTVHLHDERSATIELANKASEKSTNSFVIVSPPQTNEAPAPPQHGEFPNSGSVEIKHHEPSPSPLSHSHTAGIDYPETTSVLETVSAPELHQMDSHTRAYALANKDREDQLNRLATAHKLGQLDEAFDVDQKADPLMIASSASLQNERLTASTNLQNDDYYRIKKRFFHAYVRQDWHTFCVDDGLDEVRAGWVELFFDLIFVACIVHISAECAHNVVLDGGSHRRRFAADVEETESHGAHCDDGPYDYLFTGFAQFALLNTFWMEQVMYTTHFVLNEHIDELLRVFYMTFVLAMGLFVANDAAYHIGFFCSYALLRVVSCVMFFRVLWIPRARAHALYHILIHLMVIVVLIGLVAARFSKCALDYFAIYSVLWVVEYGSGVLQWTLSDYCCKMDADKKKAIALPLNVPHISERYGLFVMIILGEALIAIMSTDMGQLDLYQKFEFTDDGPPEIVKVFFFLGIFIMSYCIGRLYFNCQPSEEAILLGTGNHALRISKNRARLYIHSHMVLFMALLGYGIGIKIAGKYVLDPDENHWIVIMLPGYSLFLIVICLNIIRAAHPFDANKKIWSFRFIVMVILFVVPLFATSEVIKDAMIWGVQLLCLLGLVATDVEGEQKRIDQRHHHDKKREAAKEHMELKKKQEEDNHRFRRHLRYLVSGIGFL